jgi:hypothetical protein
MASTTLEHRIFNPLLLYRDEIFEVASNEEDTDYVAFFA